MKLLAVFLAILAVQASCFKHTEKATNLCLFPHRCSEKQQVTCQDKEVHKLIKMKWPKELPMSWAKILEDPNVQTVMPDITHCVELKRLLKNYKMRSPNELPMSSLKLIEACKSYDVVPDIDLKSFPEKYLDNHRDKNDKATEIELLNVQPLSSAKLAEVSRSNAVVPNIYLKSWSEKYLDNYSDKLFSSTEPTEFTRSGYVLPGIGLKSVPMKENHRDKKDKDSAVPNAAPVIPLNLLQVLRSHAAVPDCISCINLIRQQKVHLDDNGSLELPLRSNAVTLELKPCDDLSQRQKEYVDYERGLKDNYRKHGRSRKLLS